MDLRVELLEHTLLLLPVLVQVEVVVTLLSALTVHLL
jgi:hypothetical protein